jgi:hypothetical protein
MNDNQWQNLIFKIEERFSIDDQHTEDVVVDELSSGEKIKGKVEVIEFKGPLGKIKLERETRPRVAGKKTFYSRRIGGRMAEDYVYSKEETVSKVKAYKWDETSNDWTEIEIPI